MGQLFKAAVIAGVLLAASAVPSLASTVINIGNSGKAVYDDTYAIDLTAQSTVTVSGLDLSISPFSAVLPGVTITNIATGVPPIEAFFGSDVLAAGDYTLTITGSAVSPLAPFSFYGGTVTLTPFVGGGASTTPLPGTFVLFLAGLGMLGFLGWRKASNASLRSIVTA